MAIFITRPVVGTETGTTRKYIFQEVNNMQDRSIQNNIKFSSPNQGSDESIVFNLNGISRIVSFNFNIVDDGTDKADGTHTSTVITLQQQYDYLKQVFVTGDTGAEYTLTVEFDGSTLFIVSGMINNLTPNLVFNRPNTINVTFEFEEGNNPLKVT